MPSRAPFSLVSGTSRDPWPLAWSQGNLNRRRRHPSYSDGTNLICHKWDAFFLLWGPMFFVFGQEQMLRTRITIFVYLFHHIKRTISGEGVRENGLKWSMLQRLGNQAQTYKGPKAFSLGMRNGHTYRKKSYSRKITFFRGGCIKCFDEYRFLGW